MDAGSSRGKRTRAQPGQAGDAPGARRRAQRAPAGRGQVSTCTIVFDIGVGFFLTLTLHLGLTRSGHLAAPLVACARSTGPKHKSTTILYYFHFILSQRPGCLHLSPLHTCASPSPTQPGAVVGPHDNRAPRAPARPTSGPDPGLGPARAGHGLSPSPTPERRAGFPSTCRRALGAPARRDPRRGGAARTRLRPEPRPRGRGGRVRPPPSITVAAAKRGAAAPGPGCLRARSRRQGVEGFVSRRPRGAVREDRPRGSP